MATATSSEPNDVDYATIVHKNIASFYSSKEISDCVFVVGKQRKEYPAIRALFAMQSKYFERLLFNSRFNTTSIVNDRKKEGTTNHVTRGFPTYYETDVSNVAFEFIMQYCYGIGASNMPKIDAQNVIQIYYAALKYFIKPIENNCIKFLDNKIDYNNVFPVFYQALGYGLKDIQSKLFEIIKSSADRLIENELVLQLPYKWFLDLFAKNENSCVKEKDIYQICVKYCKHAISRNKNDEKEEKKDQQSLDDSDIKEELISECKFDFATDVQIDSAINVEKQDFESWQSMMRALFVPFVRFSIMDKKYFTTVVRSSDLLSKKELWNVLDTWYAIEENPSSITCYQRSSQISINNNRTNTNTNINTMQTPGSDSSQQAISTRSTFGLQFSTSISDFRLRTKPDESPTPMSILLRYDISMSEERFLGRKGYSDLTSDILVFGAATEASVNPFIQATFEEKSVITSIQVGPPAKKMRKGPWLLNEINGAYIQYLRDPRPWRSETQSQWTNIVQIGGLEYNKVKSYTVSPHRRTTAIRVIFIHNEEKHLGIGCLRVWGYSE